MDEAEQLVPRVGTDRGRDAEINPSSHNPQPEQIASNALSASRLPDFDEKDDHSSSSSAFAAAQSDEPGLPAYTYSPPTSRKFDSFLNSLVQDTPDEEAGAFVFQSSSVPASDSATAATAATAATSAREAEYQLPPLVAGYAMSSEEAYRAGSSHAQLDPSFRQDRSASSSTPATSLLSDSIASRATSSLVNRFRNEFDAFQADFEADYYKVRAQIDQQGASELAPSSSASTGADTLRGLIGNYFAAQVKLEEAISTVRTEDVSCENALDRLWSKRPISQTFSASCGDGQVVSHSFSWEIAEFDQAAAAALATRLQLLSESKIGGATLLKFNMISSRIDVELFVHGILQRLHETVTTESTAGSVEQGPAVLKSLGEIRECLSVLFAYERELERINSQPTAKPSISASAFSVQRTLRNWLSIMADALFRVGSSGDHKFVLNQAIRTRGISSWSHLIQFPPLFQRISCDHVLRTSSSMSTLNAPAAPISGYSSASSFSSVAEAADSAGMPAYHHQSDAALHHALRECQLAWSDEARQNFLSMLTALLSPLEFARVEVAGKQDASTSKFSRKEFSLCQLKALSLDFRGSSSASLFTHAGGSVITAGGPSTAGGSSSSDALETIDGDAGIDEWEVVEEPIPTLEANGDTSLRLCANESDLLAAFTAFPIQSFLDALFLESFIAPQTTAQLAQSVSNSFATAKVLLALLANALHQVPEYIQFGKLVAQAICYLSWAPIVAWRATLPLSRLERHSKASSSRHNQQSSHDIDIPALFQREIDWISMRSAVNLRRARQSGVNYFLSDAPFRFLSPPAAAQIFLAIVWNRDPSHFKDSAAVLHDIEFDNWKMLIRADPHRRMMFAHQLASDSGNGIHILHALNQIACYARGDLPLIWVNEICHVAFVQPATREQLYRACLPFFGAACAQDPRAISVLLEATVRNFHCIENLSIAIFQHIDLGCWTPTRDDWLRIHALLMHPFASPRFRLGEFLLESLDFGFKQGQEQPPTELADPPQGVAPEVNEDDDSKSWLAPSSIMLSQAAEQYGPGSNAFEVDQRRKSQAPYQRAALAASHIAPPAVSPKSAPHLRVSAETHRRVLLLIAEVRLAHLLLISRYDLKQIVASHAAPPHWWCENLLCLQTQSILTGLPLVDPQESGSFLATLRRDLLSGALVRRWSTAFDSISPVDAVGSVDAVGAAALSQSSQSSSATMSPHISAALAEAFAISARPPASEQIDLFFSDPVLLYADAQVSANSVSTSDMVSLIANGAEFQPLAFRLVHDFQRSPRVDLGQCRRFLSSILALDQPSVIMRLFTSQYFTFPRMAFLLPLVSSHVLAAAASPHPSSVKLVQFWLSELDIFSGVAAPSDSATEVQVASSLPIAWTGYHNCLLVAETIATAAMLAEINTDCTAQSVRTLVERFLVQQCARLPFEPVSEREREFTPPPLLLSGLRSAEATKYYPWLSFLSAVAAVRSHWPGWEALGRLIVANVHSGNAKAVLKSMGFSKLLFWNSIIRLIGNLCLAVEVANPLLPLYWQLYFKLYFSQVKIARSGAAEGDRYANFGFSLMQGNSGAALSKQILARLERIAFELKAVKITSPAQNQWPGLFAAMRVWLIHPNPAHLMASLPSLKPEHLPARLLSLAQDSVQQHNFFWWDLVDTTSIWLNDILPNCSMHFASIALTFYECIRHPLDPPKSSREKPRWYSALQRTGVSLPIALSRIAARDAGGIVANIKTAVFGKDSVVGLRISRRLSWSALESAQINVDVPSLASSRSWVTAGPLELSSSDSKVRGTPASLVWKPSLPVATGCFLELTPALQRPVSDIGVLSPASCSELCAHIAMVAHQFGERRSAQAILNVQLLDVAALLMRNEPDLRIYQQKCIHSCTRAAQIEARCSKVVAISANAAALHSTRTSSRTCFTATETGIEIASTFAQILRIIAWLLAKQPLAQHQAIQNEVGQTWFYSLLQLCRSDVSQYSPAHQLQPWLAPLANKFVPASSFAAQSKLLRACVDHASVMNDIVAAALWPMVVEKARLMRVMEAPFVDGPGSSSVASSEESASLGFFALFRAAENTVYVKRNTALLSFTNLVAVFSKFDFKQWISTSAPPLDERVEVVSFALRCLVAEYDVSQHAMPAAQVEWWSFLQHAICDIIGSSMASMHRDFFRAVLNRSVPQHMAAQSKSCPPIVWTSLLRLPWDELTASDLAAVANMLSQAFSQWRSSVFVKAANELGQPRHNAIHLPHVTCPSMLAMWRPYSDLMFQFCHCIVYALCARVQLDELGSAADALDQVWGTIQRLFAPWLQSFVLVDAPMADLVARWLFHHGIPKSQFSVPIGVHAPSWDLVTDSAGIRNCFSAFAACARRAIGLASYSSGLRVLLNIYVTDLLPFANCDWLGLVHEKLLEFDWAENRVSADLLRQLDLVLSSYAGFKAIASSSSSSSASAAVSSAIPVAELPAWLSLAPASGEKLNQVGQFFSRIVHLSSLSTHLLQSAAFPPLPSASDNAFLSATNASVCSVRSNFWTDFLFDVAHQQRTQADHVGISKLTITVLIKLISISKWPLASGVWIDAENRVAPSSADASKSDAAHRRSESAFTMGPVVSSESAAHQASGIVAGIMNRAWPELAASDFREILDCAGDAIASDVWTQCDNSNGSVRSRVFFLLAWLLRSTLSVPLPIGQLVESLPAAPGAVVPLLSDSIDKLALYNEWLVSRHSDVSRLVSAAQMADLVHAVRGQLLSCHGLLVSARRSLEPDAPLNAPYLHASAVAILQDSFSLLNTLQQSEQSKSSSSDTNNIVALAVEKLVSLAMFAPLALRLACRHILSVPRLARVCELVITSAIGDEWSGARRISSVAVPVAQPGPGAMAPVQQQELPRLALPFWTGLVAQMAPPELNEVEFVRTCQTGGHMCTLLLSHVAKLVALQRRGAAAVAALQSECERLLSAAWNEQIVVPERGEPVILLLWSTALAFLVAAVRGGGANRKQAESHLVAQFSGKVLLRFGEDRQSGGISGFFGLGAASRFSPRFRLVCRAWAMFFRLQTDRNGALLFDDGADETQRPRAPRTSDERRRDLVDFARACGAENAEYREVRGQAGTLIEFFRENLHTPMPLVASLALVQRVMMGVFPIGGGGAAGSDASASAGADASAGASASTSAVDQLAPSDWVAAATAVARLGGLDW